MADDQVVTKLLAETIAGSVDVTRVELDRARGEVRAAEERVRTLEAKFADRVAWLARIIEGLPMDRVNAADKATQSESVTPAGSSQESDR